MYESFFTYNVTRPYPYRWLTWFIVIGGCIATALLSVVNLAATGYQIKAVYVDNPNATVHPENPAWYHKRPWSFASKVSSTCQDQIIDAGSQIYTGNQGLPYTVIGAIKVPQHGESATNSSLSFPYRNDFLQNCTIANLAVEGRGDPDDSVLNVSVYMGCMVFVEGELTAISLGFVGDLTLSPITAAGNREDSLGITYVGPSIVRLPYWNTLQPYKQPSLWWGQHIIGGLARLINNGIYLKGTWSFIPNLLGPDGKNTTIVSTEIKAPYNLNITINDTEMGNWSYVATQQWALESWSDPLGGSNESSDFTVKLYLDEGAGIPVNLTSSDRMDDFYRTDLLGVALYATFLSDLGQNVTSNALASPERTIQLINWTRFVDTQYAADPLGYFQLRETGVPSVSPTTLALRYLCQIPEMKALGSVIIGILVADFVFLQALWVTTKLIITFFLERRDPRAHYCAGCLSGKEFENSGSDNVVSNVGSVSLQANKPLPPLPTPSEIASREEFGTVAVHRTHSGYQQIESRLNDVETDGLIVGRFN